MEWDEGLLLSNNPKRSCTEMKHASEALYSSYFYHPTYHDILLTIFLLIVFAQIKCLKKWHF